MRAIKQWRQEAKEARELKNKALDIFLTQLELEDLSLEERRDLVKHVRNMLDAGEQRELNDLECAEIVGSIKGIWEGAACVVGGYAIGTLIGKILRKG